MSKLEDLMPADLRERLRTLPPRDLPSAWPYLESTCSEWIAARPAAETAARRHADAWRALEADVRAWRETALTSGQIVASGWPAGKVGMSARVAIPAEAWAALRYHSGKNAAVARASGAVVFEGLDFAPCDQDRVQAKIGGRPRKATFEEIAAAVQRERIRPETLTLTEFFKRLKAADVNPSQAALETYCRQHPNFENYRARFRSTARQIFGR